MSLPVVLGSTDAGKGLVEVPFQASQAADGAVVGLGGRIERDIGGDHHPDLLADVVEGEDLVEEQQAGIGDAEFVGGLIGDALDQADRVVSEKADGSGGERRQAWQARGFVAAERVAQRGENVAFNMGGAAALGYGQRAATGDDALVRREADESVAAHLLAAFHRFQQEALAAPTRPRAGMRRLASPGRRSRFGRRAPACARARA